MCFPQCMPNFSISVESIPLSPISSTCQKKITIRINGTNYRPNSRRNSILERSPARMLDKYKLRCKCPNSCIIFQFHQFGRKCSVALLVFRIRDLSCRAMSLSIRNDGDKPRYISIECSWKQLLLKLFQVLLSLRVHEAVSHAKCACAGERRQQHHS